MASFRSARTLTAPNILWGKLVARLSSLTLLLLFLGGKSHNESVAKGFSYLVLVLDNVIPPASSSRAEDVPEDKCHYLLSVM